MTSPAPLGVSWYVLEKWISGKGIRNAAEDTILSTQLTPQLCAQHGLHAGFDTAELAPESLTALCLELDIGYSDRATQLAALNSSVTSTADVHRFIIVPKCLAAGRRSIAESLIGCMVTETLWNQPVRACLLYTSPSPRDRQKSRMPSSA